ncbi:AfsR/SARP family transcriptional regulator [Plantactinospora veratri]
MGANDAEATARAVTVLHDALGLWRGPAFADVADRPFALNEVARLGALHRSARLAHAEALASLGRYGEVVVELSGVVAEEPYDEGLRRLLAVALYAEQRVDEAAGLCRAGLLLLRQRGIDAPGLQELQRQILRRDVPLHRPPGSAAGTAAVVPEPAATGPAPTPATPPGTASGIETGGGSGERVSAGSVAPHLLPPDPARFVGREAELDDIRRRLDDLTDRAETLVITGPPGVGKSSLAIRAGHAVADRFPDGQLYVNLRGFDQTGSVLGPGEAIRGSSTRSAYRSSSFR